MEQMEMLQEGYVYPPKVKAMYEAVLELFASGRELSSIKVSEITAKAGIGKGTAYEYFSSKEEMIIGAMRYEAIRHLGLVMDLIREGQSFQEIIFKGLDMMEAADERFGGLALVARILRDSTMTGSGFLDVLEKQKEECSLVQGFTKRLLEMAVDSGIIKETQPYKVWSAIITQLMFYAFYLEHREWMADVSREEAREFTYHSILKILN
ncbi:TetR/AcrR family transcriptional regulator [Lachnospiraceae bacterium 29-84]